MTVAIPSGRGIVPVWYQTKEGKKFVRFVRLGNSPVILELAADGCKILSLQDLIHETA